MDTIVSAISDYASSLDSKSHISRWTKKQKRHYSRIKSGLTRAKARGRRVIFLTLTSSEHMLFSTLRHRFEALKQRVRYYFGEFEYCKVVTNEGGGVIHLVYFAKWLTDNLYSSIHAWFSVNWGDLNRSPVVWNVNVWTDKGMAAYLVNQYLSREDCSYTRIAWSWSWVCRGFVGMFKDILVKFGFDKGIVVWNGLLKRASMYGSVQIKLLP